MQNSIQTNNFENINARTNSRSQGEVSKKEFTDSFFQTSGKNYFNRTCINQNQKIFGLPKLINLVSPVCEQSYQKVSDKNQRKNSHYIQNHWSADKRQVVQFLLVPLWNFQNTKKLKASVGGQKFGHQSDSKQTILKNINQKTVTNNSNNGFIFSNKDKTKDILNSRKRSFYFIGNLSFSNYSSCNDKAEQSEHDYFAQRSLKKVTTLARFDFLKSSLELTTLRSFLETEKTSQNFAANFKNSSIAQRKNPVYLTYWILPFLGLIPLLKISFNDFKFTNSSDTQKAFWALKQEGGFMNHSTERMETTYAINSLEGTLVPNQPKYLNSEAINEPINQLSSLNWHNQSSGQDSESQSPVFDNIMARCLIQNYLKEIYGLSSDNNLLKNLKVDKLNPKQVLKQTNSKELLSWFNKIVSKPTNKFVETKRTKNALTKKSNMENRILVAQIGEKSEINVKHNNKNNPIVNNEELAQGVVHYPYNLTLAIKTSKFNAFDINQSKRFVDTFSNDSFSQACTNYFRYSLFSNSKKSKVEKAQLEPLVYLSKVDYLNLLQKSEQNSTSVNNRIQKDLMGLNELNVNMIFQLDFYKKNSLKFLFNRSNSILESIMQPFEADTNVLSNHIKTNENNSSSQFRAILNNLQAINMFKAFNGELESTLNKLLITNKPALNSFIKSSPNFNFKMNYLCHPLPINNIVTTNKTTANSDRRFFAKQDIKTLNLDKHIFRQNSLKLNNFTTVNEIYMNYLPIKSNINQKSTINSKVELQKDLFVGANKPMGSYLGKVTNLSNYIKLIKSKLNLTLNYIKKHEDSANLNNFNKVDKIYSKNFYYPINSILNHKKLHFVSMKELGTLNKLVKNPTLIKFDQSLRNVDTLTENCNESLNQNELSYIERKKEVQKKRKAKKLRLESRRQKKRKRFYPRPVWLRLRLGLKSPRSSSFQSSFTNFTNELNSKWQNEFNNRISKKIFGSLGVKKDVNFIKGLSNSLFNRDNLIELNLKKNVSVRARQSYLLSLKNKANYVNFETKSANSTIPKKENKNGVIDSFVKDFWIWLYNLTNTNLKEYNKTILFKVTGADNSLVLINRIDRSNHLKKAKLKQVNENLNSKNSPTLIQLNTISQKKMTIKNESLALLTHSYTNKTPILSLENSLIKENLRLSLWAFNKTNLWSITNKRLNLWSAQKLRNQSKNNKTKFLEKQLKKSLNLAFAPKSAQHSLLFNQLSTGSEGKLQSFEFLAKQVFSQSSENNLSGLNISTETINKLKKRISQKLHQKEQKLSYLGKRLRLFNRNPSLEIDLVRRNSSSQTKAFQLFSNPLLEFYSHSHNKQVWWENIPSVSTKVWKPANELNVNKSFFNTNTPVWLGLLFHFCAVLSLLSINQIRCFIKFHLILLHKLSSFYYQTLYAFALTVRTKTNNLVKGLIVREKSQESNINYLFLENSKQNIKKTLRLKYQDTTFLTTLQEFHKTRQSKRFIRKDKFNSNKGSVLQKQQPINKNPFNIIKTGIFNLDKSSIASINDLINTQVKKRSYNNVYLPPGINSLYSVPGLKPGPEGKNKQDLNFNTSKKRILTKLESEGYPQNNKLLSLRDQASLEFFKGEFQTTNFKHTTNLVKCLNMYLLIQQMQLSEISHLTGNVIKKQTINTTYKIVDTFESWLKFIYGFFEKPAEFTMDWIAYAFLVEWSSDLLAFTPSKIETMNSKTFSKVVKQNSLSLAFYTNSLIVQPKFAEQAIFKSFENLYAIPVSQFLTKRLLYLNDSFLAILYRPDTDLLNRQKKGTLFWDIWSDLLIKAADKYNINVPSLSNIKEEQNLLLENFLSTTEENKTKKVHSILKNESLSENKKAIQKHFNKNSLNFIGDVILNKINFDSKFDRNDNRRKTYFYLKNQALNLNIEEFVTLKHNNRTSISQTDQNSTKDKLIQTNNTLTSSNPLDQINFQLYQSKNVQQYITYQSKETDLFLDYHPPKSFSYISAIKYYTIVQQPIGSLVCQIYSGLLTTQIAKNVLVIGSTLGSNASSGAGGFENLQKTLLIQALAGETEMKIITDNSSRYAVVSRGFAIGIKYLKEVFEAITLNTPCLFLLEDIHLIGERRPLLISDYGDSMGGGGSSDLSKTAETTFGSQRNGDAVHEKNQIYYQLSRHAITHSKKPFKGDFSLTIPANHFAFDLFLKRRSNSLNKATTHPLAYQLNIFGRNSVISELGQTSKNEGTGGFSDSNNKNSRNIQTFSHEGNSYSRIKPNGSNSSESSLHSTGLQSSSPFSVLLLKEQKRLKANKTVNELPWVSLPTEQLSILPRVSYSVRAKIAALAELGFSNMSAKLDMITDLLVIIDSVRGNRGFVVFATTHLPHILDPALRRPGRLDETISLPTLSNLWTRWEFSKYSNPISFYAFNQGNLRPFSQSQNSLHVKNRTNLTNFLNGTFGIYQKQHLAWNGTLDALDFFNLASVSFSSKTNPNSLTSNIFSPILSGLTKISDLSFKTNNIVSPNNDLDNSRVSILKTTVAHTAYYQIGKKLLRNKYVFTLSNANSIYLNPILKNSFVKQTHFSETSLLTEASESILFYGPESLKYKSLYGSTANFKNILMGLMAGKFAEYFAFNNLPIYKSKQMISNSTSIELVKPFTLNYNKNIKPSLNFLYGIDATWRTATTFALSLVQKRYLFNKNLIVPKLFQFLDSNSLEEPPSPPTSNILIPAKRYENFKKSLKQVIQSKLIGLGSTLLNEKLQAHTKQGYIKNIYAQKVEQKNNTGDFIQSNANNIENTIASNLLRLTVSDINKNLLLQPTSASIIYKNLLLKRHRMSLNNQWWNGQLTEHTAESLFLSDIDWRYTFIGDTFNNKIRSNLSNAGLNSTNFISQASKKDMEQKAINRVVTPKDFNFNNSGNKEVLIDFPDAEQYYNPMQRRWVITSGYWDSWFNFDKQMQAEVLNHLILESVIQSYLIFNQNREYLDCYVAKFIKKGVLKIF